MDWIMLAGLCVTAIGGFILGFTLFRAKNVIDGMSTTYYDSNAILRKELYKERNRAIWGISFLLIVCTSNHTQLLFAWSISNGYTEGQKLFTTVTI